MTQRLTNRRNAIKFIAAPAISTGLTAIFGLNLSGCTEDKPSFNAIDITGADYGRGFSVKDANGQLRTVADFKGKVLVVFFGFAQCPDVCPTTMAELAQVKQALGPDADKLAVAFVTVDPERDTPAVLKAYMQSFDPSFVALVPTPAELPALAKSFKVYYKQVEGPTPTSYTMEHSAGSYIFDPKGQLRLYARYGMPQAQWVADIKTLLKG